MTSLQFPHSAPLQPEPLTRSPKAALLDLLFTRGVKLLMVLFLVVGLALPLMTMLGKVVDVQDGLAGVWQLLSSPQIGRAHV